MEVIIYPTGGPSKEVLRSGHTERLWRRKQPWVYVITPNGNIAHSKIRGVCDVAFRPLESVSVNEPLLL